jgi:hypothetical protein
MQCEDCGRRAEADRSEGWVAVRLESDRGVEVFDVLRGLREAVRVGRQFADQFVGPIFRANAFARTMSTQPKPRIRVPKVMSLFAKRSC